MKGALLKEKTTLEAELKTLGVQNPEVKGDWVTAQQTTPESDSNLVADHTEEYDENRAVLANLETEYNRVIEALHKIESGEYGICTVCENPIEPKRLTALPSANTCISHKDSNKD